MFIYVYASKLNSISNRKIMNLKKKKNRIKNYNKNRWIEQCLWMVKQTDIQISKIEIANDLAFDDVDDVYMYYIFDIHSYICAINLKLFPSLILFYFDIFTNRFVLNFYHSNRFQTIYSLIFTFISVVQISMSWC